MVHLRTASLLSRGLPAWTRERVFAAAYDDLLGEYLTARAAARGVPEAVRGLELIEQGRWPTSGRPRDGVQSTDG